MPRIIDKDYANEIQIFAHTMNIWVIEPEEFIAELYYYQYPHLLTLVLERALDQNEESEKLQKEKFILPKGGVGATYVLY